MRDFVEEVFGLHVIAPLDVLHSKLQPAFVYPYLFEDSRRAVVNYVERNELLGVVIGWIFKGLDLLKIELLLLLVEYVGVLLALDQCICSRLPAKVHEQAGSLHDRHFGQDLVLDDFLVEQLEQMKDRELLDREVVVFQELGHIIDVVERQFRLGESVS